MKYTINSATFDDDKQSVETEMEFIRPDPIRKYYVIVNHRRYSPNQVLEVITGLPRVQCKTLYSVPILHRLGFKIHKY